MTPAHEATLDEHAENLNTLADLHEVSTKGIAENRAGIIQAHDKIDDLSAKVDTFFGSKVGKMVGGIIVSLLLAATAWVTDRVNQSGKELAQPPNITVNAPPAQPHVTDSQPSKLATEPKPVVPVLRYSYAIIKGSELPKGLPPGPVEVYAAGTTWSWNGTVTPLPVQIVTDAGSNVVEVKGLK